MVDGLITNCFRFVELRGGCDGAFRGVRSCLNMKAMLKRNGTSLQESEELCLHLVSLI